MMLSVSTRGKIMPSSPIRKLVPYAEAAKKRGITVYHLNIGQPDIETPEHALAAVRHSDFKILEYSHSAGQESYRRKLVDYYKRRAIEVDYTEMIITTGGSEALLFCMMACMDAGDEVIVPEPFYANYKGFATEVGVTVVPVTSHIKDSFALPPIASLREKITARTKAILICSPNNPTGYLYNQQEMETLGEIVRQHSLFLISDEAYREFCYSGKHFSAMQLEGVDDNVILVDTISKRYSSCGARIGALVSKNKQIIETALKFAQARLSPPTFGQMVGEAALDLPDNYFDATKKEYKQRRDTLVKRLNAIPGVFCPEPGGAFYAMAKLPVDDSEKFCQWILESFSYNNQTVMMAPAAGFYETPGLGKEEVRFAYVINTEAINHAMDCLEKALEIYRQLA